MFESSHSDFCLLVKSVHPKSKDIQSIKGFRKLTRGIQIKALKLPWVIFKYHLLKGFLAFPTITFKSTSHKFQAKKRHTMKLLLDSRFNQDLLLKIPLDFRIALLPLLWLTQKKRLCCRSDHSYHLVWSGFQHLVAGSCGVNSV